MRALLDKLDPQYKKYAVGVLAALGLVAMVSLTTGESQTEEVQIGRNETIRNVLTSGNTRRVSVDAIDARLERTINDVGNLKRSVKQQEQQLNSARSQSTNAGINGFTPRAAKLSNNQASR